MNEASEREAFEAWWKELPRFDDRFKDATFRGWKARAAVPAHLVQQPTSRVLPNPGSAEASAMMDSLLAEYNWPANTKNAARAGWEAANRWLAATPQAAVPEVQPWAAAVVRIQKTGGNVGIAWTAEPLDSAPMMRDGELLYVAAAPRPALVEAAQEARTALSELIASGDRRVFADALAKLDAALGGVPSGRCVRVGEPCECAPEAKQGCVSWRASGVSGTAETKES